MPDATTPSRQPSQPCCNASPGRWRFGVPDVQQKSMLGSYLAEIKFPINARVIEIGCGTGPVARRLAGWPNVGQVIGVDPCSAFIEKARQLDAGLANLTFEEGHANQLRFADSHFDVTVFHTTLCHLSNPKGAMQEAHRVLKPEAWPAVFDGDYADHPCDRELKYSPALCGVL